MVRTVSTVPDSLHQRYAADSRTFTGADNR
jgi:hypothetical protein